MKLRKNQASPIELASGVLSARYFCITSKPDSSDFYYLGGFEACGPGYDLKRDSFPFLTLELIVAGSGELTLGHKTYPLSAGFCGCTGPGVNFRLKSDKQDPLQKYFIVFGDDTRPEKRHPRLLYPGFTKEAKSLDDLIKWSELILQEGVSQRDDAADNISSLIQILSRRIAGPQSGTSRKHSHSALTSMALQEIEQNFHRIHTIQDLARDMNVSQEHLCRVFKRSGKGSPYQILMRRKLEHAYTQLKLTSHSIQHIARSLGFADAFQFSRAFKRKYGIPPSEAR